MGSWSRNAVASLSFVDPWIQHAIQEIEKYQGVRVSATAKAKSLLKFGTNELVGTTEATVMTLPAGRDRLPYISTNGITHFSSDDASDTSHTFRVEGHTIANGLLTFVVQTVQLDATNGQTPVALPTPLNTCTRAYETDVNGQAVGNVYFYENGAVTGGVPNDTSTVHLIVPAGEHQSKKCATSVSNADYWLITEIGASIGRKQAATADVRLRTAVVGGPLRTRWRVSISTSANGNVLQTFQPPIIIDRNTHVEMTAESSNAGTLISGTINGVLLSVLG